MARRFRARRSRSRVAKRTRRFTKRRTVRRRSSRPRRPMPVADAQTIVPYVLNPGRPRNHLFKKTFNIAWVNGAAAQVGPSAQTLFAAGTYASFVSNMGVVPAAHGLCKISLDMLQAGDILGIQEMWRFYKIKKWKYTFTIQQQVGVAGTGISTVTWPRLYIRYMYDNDIQTMATSVSRMQEMRNVKTFLMQPDKVATYTVYPRVQRPIVQTPSLTTYFPVKSTWLETDATGINLEHWGVQFILDTLPPGVQFLIHVTATVVCKEDK